MISWIWLIPAAMAGAALGVLALATAAAGREGDHKMETYIKKTDATQAVRDYCKACIDNGQSGADMVDLAVELARVINTVPQYRLPMVECDHTESGLLEE